MEKIYQVGGILNQGFVGQISYTVCLDQPYKEIAIDFSFNKQRFEIITDDLKQFLIKECNGQYGADTASDEEILSALKEMKTELQLAFTLNDTFIGGIHRQDNPKHIYISTHEATEGCIPQPSIEGTLRITIMSFSVILDDTHYTLTLSGQ